MPFTSNSPRKVAPLSTGDETRPRTPASSSTTVRAFYCGVIVDSGNGKDLDEGVLLRYYRFVSINRQTPCSDVRTLVSSLGENLSPAVESMNRTQTSTSPAVNVNT